MNTLSVLLSQDLQASRPKLNIIQPFNVEDKLIQ